MKIAIVDDQISGLSLLEEFLKHQNEISAVHAFSNGQDLLSFLEENIIDLLLLDLELPSKLSIDGFEIAEEIKQSKAIKVPKILCYSMNTQSHVVRRAIRTLELDGFIDKHTDGKDDLILAINQVMKEGFYISNSLKEKAERILNFEKLSPREIEIIEMIVKGKSNNEIGEDLFIAPKTVDNHRQNIHRKLHCKKATELIRKYDQFLYLHHDDEEMLPNFKRKKKGLN